MQALLIASLVAAGLAAVVALTVLPLRFGWRRQVTWLVRAQAVSCVGGPYWAPLDLREVAVTAVERAGSGLELWVLEAGHPVGHTMALEADRLPSDLVIEMLGEWSALRTPMLLFVDSAGVASLHGPAAVVGGLRRREGSMVDDRRGGG